MITLLVGNDRQLDEQLDELCAGLIATEPGLLAFSLAVEKASKAIKEADYPMPPECLGDRIGAAVYEGYRLGMARMAGLLIQGGREGLDLRILYLANHEGHEGTRSKGTADKRG